MSIIPWARLDGPAVVGSFISRRVQPRKRRIHAGYEYQGSADTTRMKKERLERTKVHRRMNELFNLADMNYTPTNNIKHAYKLARPPPKVSICILNFLSLAIYITEHMSSVLSLSE